MNYKFEIKMINDKRTKQKRNKKELVLWPYIYHNYFLSKIVSSKIMKNLRVKYLLVTYVGRKSNLGCQINCQGRYLYEVGK